MYWSPQAHAFPSHELGWNLAEWEEQFRTQFNACETTKTLKDVQVAILLHAAGPGALEIHPHFSFAMGDAKDDYETILNKFGS